MSFKALNYFSALVLFYLSNNGINSDSQVMVFQLRESPTSEYNMFP